jgi:hypothetical protein
LWDGIFQDTAISGAADCWTAVLLVQPRMVEVTLEEGPAFLSLASSFAGGPRGHSMTPPVTLIWK